MRHELNKAPEALELWKHHSPGAFFICKKYFEKIKKCLKYHPTSGTMKTVKKDNTKTEETKMRQSSIMKLDRTHQDKEFIEKLANEKCVYYVRCLGKKFYEGNVVTEWYVEFNNEGCVMLFEK